LSSSCRSYTSLNYIQLIDALGAIASGIQIADSIQRLIRFCKSIKDAPESIRNISEDLEGLDEILNSFMKYHEGIQIQGCSTPSRPVQKALSSCCSRLHDLELTISELEKGLQGRKTWTSVKVALREETIRKFQVNLESAKVSLVLANQLFQNQLLLPSVSVS
jgi:hypothetical protein